MHSIHRKEFEFKKDILAIVEKFTKETGLYVTAYIDEIYDFSSLSTRRSYQVKLTYHIEKKCEY